MLSVDDVTLNGVPARDYRPVANPIATIVFYHGGGWTVGSVADYDHFARTLAAATSARVVSVDYRLAPEHPFPAAVDDAWAALTGIAPTGLLFVAGDSAGGNLAAVVAQRARDESAPKLAGQILIYPSVAGTIDTPAMHAFVPPMMPRDDIAAYYDLYVPDIVDRQDPRFAPASGDLSRLPPAIVITAGADLLAAEAEAYADALEAACVDVTLHRQEGALHAYLTLLPDTAASQSTMSEIVGFVARRVVESRS